MKKFFEKQELNPFFKKANLLYTYTLTFNERDIK